MEKIRAWWKAVLEDPAGYFLNFKTFDGGWQLVVGLLVIYTAIVHVQYVIALYFIVRGIQMAYTGAYNLVINPVKKEAEFQVKVEAQMSEAVVESKVAEAVNVGNS